MINSERVPKAEGLAVADGDLRHNGEAGAKASPPPAPFSRSFVATLVAAIEQGNISVRRAASLTDLEPDELGDLCDVHGLKRPMEL